MTSWPVTLRTPKDFYTLHLDDETTRIYRPHPPFNLEEDECSQIVSWKQFQVPGTEEEVRMLCFKEGIDFNDKDLKTGIAGTINYHLWLERTDKKKTKKNKENPNQQPENDIKSLLETQLSTIKTTVHNTIENKIRYEFQKRFDNRRDYNRSPPRRSTPRSPSPRRSPPKRIRSDETTNISNPNQQPQQLQQQTALMYGYGMGQMIPQNYMLQQPGIIPNPMTNMNPMMGLNGMNNPSISGTYTPK